jgi:hypothetical protein
MLEVVASEQDLSMTQVIERSVRRFYAAYQRRRELRVPKSQSFSEPAQEAQSFVEGVPASGSEGLL